MIQIHLRAAGKKFQGQWIFRNLDLQVSGPERIAITGLNGSGKSTLLQVLSGFQSLNEGQITYSEKGALIRPESWYTYLGYAAPYLDLHEEYNMHELISFHATFKPFQHPLDEKSIIEIMELEGSSHKAIRHFSSGMKQRLKIALAVLSKAPVLLMDEPLSNLDRQGTSWYRNMIENFAAAKTIIICSNNIEEEIAFCERRINLHDYKV